ncbi:MAG: Asp-tRNA(Asn)/Glu-tRNA(Gln) amidotransferase subunit GatC [Proteobacteria bacterium]|nr:Asp-tRNA(Asn)/Glu-tRNA(Gln) amidotransferase subunit GatC [Pseudomonadota bacterium]
MKISPEEVKHVADLARLEMTPEEVESMTQQLDGILSYVAKLNELDTEGVQPTTHAISIVNVFREDQVKPSLDREDVLANAPQQDNESFVVPKVI